MCARARAPAPPLRRGYLHALPRPVPGLPQNHPRRHRLTAGGEGVKAAARVKAPSAARPYVPRGTESRRPGFPEQLWGYRLPAAELASSSRWEAAERAPEPRRWRVLLGFTLRLSGGDSPQLKTCSLSEKRLPGCRRGRTGEARRASGSQTARLK